MLSMQKEMTQTYKTIMKISHKVNKPCPKCHHMSLVQPGPLDKATGRPLVAPVCAYPHCGWRENAEDYTRRHRQEATNRAKQMRYNTALGYFNQYSAQENPDNMSKDTFRSFKIGNSINLKRLKGRAIDIADRMADGEPIHSLFVGSTGTGKTHLAYSVINRILSITSYRKNILLLNMFNLSVLQQKSINDLETKKWLNSLSSQVGKADLVVLDDIGREKKSRWSQSIIALTAGVRGDKPLLMTSNLEDGLSRYSQQVSDRLLPNREFSLMFRGIPSHRKVTSANSISRAHEQAVDKPF